MSDSQGRVWRCHPNQLYAVEVTLPNRDHIPERDKKFFSESRTLSLLELLPTVSCFSPHNAMQTKGKSNDILLGWLTIAPYFVIIFSCHVLCICR